MTSRTAAVVIAIITTALSVWLSVIAFTQASFYEAGFILAAVVGFGAPCGYAVAWDLWKGRCVVTDGLEGPRCTRYGRHDEHVFEQEY